MQPGRLSLPVLAGSSGCDARRRQCLSTQTVPALLRLINKENHGIYSILWAPHSLQRAVHVKCYTPTLWVYNRNAAGSHKSSVNLPVFAQWERARWGIHLFHLVVQEISSQGNDCTSKQGPQADWDARFWCVLAPLGMGFDLGTTLCWRGCP